MSMTQDSQTYSLRAEKNTNFQPDPAIVAIPLAITQCNSELVIVSMNGLIINGASVWPEIWMLKTFCRIFPIFLTYF